MKEIIYIVLSAKTTENLYKTVHKELWKRFGDVAEIANASIDELHECVAKAGLGTKRAKQLKEIARRLLNDFGKRPSYRLRRLSKIEAYEYLTSLPGVGPKSALCVMMYSLDADVKWTPTSTALFVEWERSGLERNTITLRSVCLPSFQKVVAKSFTSP